MNRARIAFVASKELPFNMQTVLQNFGRLLHEEFALDLITGVSGGLDNLEEFYRVFSFEAPAVDPKGLGFAVRACRSYLRQTTPDLMINVSQTFPLGFAMVPVAECFGVKTALRITGNIFTEPSRQHKIAAKAWKWLVHNLVAPKIYRRASASILLGEAIREQAAHHGLPPERTHIIPQPFDRSRFMPVLSDEKPALKAELGLEPDRKTILFVGRLVWGKGVDRLVEIVREVGRSSQAYQFCLVGKDGAKDHFRDFDPKLVYRPGPVPQGEIARFYQAADVLIHPSRRDGLPNVILEALSCRLPIMASPVGEIPLYVRQLSQHPADYIEYILDGEWKEDPIPSWFDWDVQRQRYTTVFREIIERRPAAAKSDVTLDVS